MPISGRQSNTRTTIERAVRDPFHIVRRLRQGPPAERVIQLLPEIRQQRTSTVMQDVIIGDLVESLGRWRVWGGLLNAAALLLFMFNTGRSMTSRGNHGDSI